MKNRSSSLLMVFVLFAAPVLFSVSFSRLYNQDLFLFFTTPGVDDEGFFDHLNVWFGDHRYCSVSQPGCSVPNNWRGIGSAALWSPGYLLFKYTSPFLKPTLGMLSVSANQWLHLGAATANFFIASAILLLILSILEAYAGPPAAFFFSIVLVFGGMPTYYLFRRPLMSHGSEAFFYLLAIYGIERIKRGGLSYAPYALVGFASAGVLAARLQNIPVIGILLGILVWERRREWKSLLLLLVVFAMSILPQLTVNRMNLGHWLTTPSLVLSFLTPGFLFQFGPAQAIRLWRLFFGMDWGLILMFPWLLFAFFVPRQKWAELWPVSKAWILAPLPSLLIDANWIAHGGSYAHRYVSLFVITAGLIAACGFERLLQGRRGTRIAACLGLGVAFFISLTHFVAFESDESKFTLALGPVESEGPVRPEWRTALNQDYVNGRYSANVYGLFTHPKALIRCFGAAPLPLYAAVKTAELRHRPPPAAVERYVAKHHIDFTSAWRYFAGVLLAEMILAGIWVQRLARLRARRNSLSPGLI